MIMSRIETALPLDDSGARAGVRLQMRCVMKGAGFHMTIVKDRDNPYRVLIPTDQSNHPLQRCCQVVDECIRSRDGKMRE
jgi:hypothetical protein